VARVIVFDVNETLLDLSALDPPFERAFGRPGLRHEWFAQLLQSALVSIVTENYADLGAIGRSALDKPFTAPHYERLLRRTASKYTRLETDTVAQGRPLCVA
jgi:hypothetical protein